MIIDDRLGHRIMAAIISAQSELGLVRYRRSPSSDEEIEAILRELDSVERDLRPVVKWVTRPAETGRQNTEGLAR